MTTEPAHYLTPQKLAALLGIRDGIENLTLEVKRATGKDGKGEIPSDFYPTYSAFANTLGGIVVLGLEEKKSGDNFIYKIAGIREPDKLIDKLSSDLNTDNKEHQSALTGNLNTDNKEPQTALTENLNTDNKEHQTEYTEKRSGDKMTAGHRDELISTFSKPLQNKIFTIGKRASPETMFLIIREICAERDSTLEEISLILNRKNKKDIYNRYLSPLLSEGKIIKIFPENPHHPNQKYRAVLTAKNTGKKK